MSTSFLFIQQTAGRGLPKTTGPRSLADAGLVSYLVPDDKAYSWDLCRGNSRHKKRFLDESARAGLILDRNFLWPRVSLSVLSLLAWFNAFSFLPISSLLYYLVLLLQPHESILSAVGPMGTSTSVDTSVHAMGISKDKDQATDRIRGSSGQSPYFTRQKSAHRPPAGACRPCGRSQIRPEHFHFFHSRKERVASSGWLHKRYRPASFFSFSTVPQFLYTVNARHRTKSVSRGVARQQRIWSRRRGGGGVRERIMCARVYVFCMCVYGSCVSFAVQGRCRGGA